MPPEPRTDDDVFARLNDLFESDVWVAVGRGLLVAVALLWLASVFAVFKDARRRVESPFLVGAAVWFATALPFLGAWLYRRLRPAHYLDELWTRRLEVRALETAMERARARACPACASPTAAGYVVCPACGERLRDRCAGCGGAVDLWWRACPWCARERVPGAPSTTPLPVAHVGATATTNGSAAQNGGGVGVAPAAHANGSANGRPATHGSAPGDAMPRRDGASEDTLAVSPDAHRDATRLRPAERG